MTRYDARTVRPTMSMDRARMADLRADFIRSYSPIGLPGLIAGNVLQSVGAMAAPGAALGRG